MSVKVRPYRNGGWEVDVQMVAPDGTKFRRRKKAPVPSKSGARAWGQALERELLAQVLSPKPIIKRKEVPKLAEFMELFLDSQKANRLKQSAQRSQESIYRTHLVPRLGDLRLDEIGPADIERMKASLSHLAPKTVNNILSVLRRSLRRAQQWELIDSVPLIEMVCVDESPAEFFDFEEMRRLVAAAKAVDLETYILVLLGARAGLRLGELLALRWEDVDLKRKRLNVSRSIVRGDEGSTKGRRGRRLPIGGQLVAALRAHRHLRSPRVLCCEDGSDLTEKRIRTMMARALRRARLPCGETGRVHVLRHTFCTHLAVKGVPVRTIQEWAGHRSLKTTMKYMHHSPSAADHFIDVLEETASTGTGFGDIVEKS